ncbi:hypothetical protein ACFQ1M_04650 [Sungkyunkwania multivorans]|uniref:Uncharacterized protein n=1 Tax=Sungkyunkwania multivorans TaxID=1173618 RepID=A0ABW3CUP0_9FLAO
MLFPRTNIEEKLVKAKNRAFKGDDILTEVARILEEDDRREERIAKEIVQPSGLENSFDLELLETEKIFHIDQIKKICIDYRLRFLDTKYFKANIPRTAIEKIKKLEKDHDTQLKGFKIIAPSKLFKLNDPDDPLLFAPIGNGYYYLIHKWGNDLHPLRRWLMLPFRNFENLLVFTLMVSYVLTLMVPNGLFSKENSGVEFWMLYFFMFKMVASIVIFYGFALGKNFNTAIWNSQYSKMR